MPIARLGQALHAAGTKPARAVQTLTGWTRPTTYIVVCAAGFAISLGLIIREVLGGEVGPIAVFILVANAIATGVILVPHDWPIVNNPDPTSSTAGFCRWAAATAGRHMIVAVFGLVMGAMMQAGLGVGLLFGLGWSSLYLTAIAASAFAHDNRPVITVAARLKARIRGLRTQVRTVPG